MANFYKPRVLFSSCLTFSKCRYDGSMINDTTVVKLRDYCTAEHICPEMGAGLSSPRKALRLILKKGNKHLIQHITDRDLSNSMKSYLQGACDNMDTPDAIILKHGSPSCGPSGVKLYHEDNLNGKPEKGSGIAADFLREKYPHALMEDEGRLRNFNIRENFYSSVFTLAEFKTLSRNPSPGALVAFHSRHKYLFMAYNEAKLREMGRITANKEKLSGHELFQTYYPLLKEVFSKHPSENHWINVLHHCYGGINKLLSTTEKELFLDSVENYRDGRIPLSVPSALLRSWALRFDITYLLNQSFLSPYPPELTEIRDSGKGRNR